MNHYDLSREYGFDPPLCLVEPEPRSFWAWNEGFTVRELDLTTGSMTARQVPAGWSQALVGDDEE